MWLKLFSGVVFVYGGDVNVCVVLFDVVLFGMLFVFNVGVVVCVIKFGIVFEGMV